MSSESDQYYSDEEEISVVNNTSSGEYLLGVIGFGT